MGVAQSTFSNIDTEKIQSDIKTQQNINNTLTENNKKLEDKIISYKLTNAEYKTKCDKLTLKLDNQEKQYKNNITNLELQIQNYKNLDDINKSLSEQIDDLRKKNDTFLDIDDELAMSIQNNQQLTDDNEVLKQEIDSINNDIEYIELTNKELEQENKSLLSDNKLQKTTNNLLSDKNKELILDNESLKLTNQNLNQNLNSSNLEIEELKKQILQLNEENTNLSISNQNINDENKILNRTTDELLIEIHDLKNKCDGLYEDNQNLVIESGELRKKNEELKLQNDIQKKNDSAFETIKEEYTIINNKIINLPDDLKQIYLLNKSKIIEQILTEYNSVIPDSFEEKIILNATDEITKIYVKYLEKFRNDI